jgi:Tfp pilus assembly protein PilN
MNAVNLIPLERRRAEAARLPGLPFLGLLGALVLALAGTVSYVEAHHAVTARRSELTRLRVGTAAWSAAAARYAPAFSALSQRAVGFSRLAVLLDQRYGWQVLLGQLAGVMPAHAQLTSLVAATPIQAPATPTSGGTPTAPSGTATPATSSSTPATAGAPSTASSTPGTTAPAGSSITIAGCAASQPVVADTMLALRRLSGVSSVSLSSSTLQSAAGTAGTGSGRCRLPVQFSLSLQFSASPAPLLLPAAARGADLAQASTTAQLAASTSPAGAVR